jgi:phosphate starvation-inducible protein PhoH
MDESQNCTQKEIVTLMTRIGEFSKCFILADPDQSDLPSGKSGGFERLRALFSGPDSKEKGIYSFEFTEEDIKRSELVKFIVKKLKELK